MRDQNEALLKSLETSDLEGELQDTLAALKQIDCWYDWELKLIQSHPVLVRERLEASLKERRRKSREPYVLHLAQVYQILGSRNMFKNHTLLAVGSATNRQLH